MKTFLTSRFLIALLMLPWLAPAVGAAENAALPEETPAAHDARMHWWREARFGLFVHWGLYAIPAGIWDGKPVPGIGEWIMDRANIPVVDYEKLAKQFNPVKYDPAEWVRAARQAGIRYLVITSKHHDGFCLFDSAVSDYNVADATPYARCLLAPLARECRKQGIVFCVYYSIMDWHHPAQYRGSAERYNPTKMHPGRKAEYVAYLKSHMKELLANCDPAVLWFDGEWPDWWTEEDGRDLYAFLRELKPEIIVNNRVGKGRKGMEGLNKGDQQYVGDFGTPEQQIPATGLPGVDWESCMTMNDTWGFKRDDHNWKSAETLIRNLVDIASKGGNYLLNVGPTAEGEIPAPSLERLAAIGHWMEKNGESISGTQASPLKATPWGRCTSKTLGPDRKRLYLHVFDWPQNGQLVVEGVTGSVTARMLDGATPLEVSAADGRLTIQLPGQMVDPIATVIVLDTDAP